ncbi:MAG: glycosyltransferase family 2 protein [Euzebyales bacterium]|nr:glycosyltransferase family 2 protein [Euzebyales bacterium]MBA3621247.1 glycosyltransferase family 2 protein [Euzebyales bacterium]
MPIRNEGGHLASSVAAVLAQDYPVGFEVVLAVGPSADDTAAVAARLAAGDPRVRVVGNPSGATAAGLNRAIAAARGEIIVRVDGHATLPPGYVRRAVELLDETGAVNVGGVMGAEGTTPFEQAVAAAMSSRFGVGDARFHYGGRPGPVDSVYLGVFRRDALAAAGGFDEAFVRTQDAELNHRLRAAGGIVWFSPELRVTYRPRGTMAGLARQYFDYGRWRRVVVRRHPESLRWRQVVAPLAVVANVSGLALGISGRRLGLLLPGTYLAAVLGASAVAGRQLPPAALARLPGVFAVLHHAWGAGFLTSPRRLASRG